MNERALRNPPLDTSVKRLADIFDPSMPVPRLIRRQEFTIIIMPAHSTIDNKMP